MAELPGFQPLYDARAMRAVDRSAIETIGIPGVVLMERAGMAAADVAQRAWPIARSAAIVCGAGNNGGDGFVAARHLAEAGWRVKVLLADAASKIRRDSRTNLDILQRLDIPVEQVNVTRWRSELTDVELILDAILGTGIDGPPRAQAEAAIVAVNRAAAPVLALDIPSGVNASTGEVVGAAIDADLTVTFHAAKVGNAIAPGRFMTGELAVADIGIPHRLDADARTGAVDHRLLQVVPGKDRDGDKFSAGRVLVAGGSPGMGGAIQLCSTATMRAGAGICWGIAPAGVASSVDAAVPEVQFAAGAQDETLARADLATVAERADRVDALVVGPGLGRHPDAVEFVAGVLELDVPTVLDADGLWALAELGEVPSARSAPLVLTPHVAELARLASSSPEDVAAARLEAARDLAVRSGAVVLLKGEDTIICRTDGSFLVARSSTSAATAGSGDVLAGIAGAMLAKQLDAPTAAAAAAVAHAAAADAAARSLGADGVMAHDIADAVPAIFEAARKLELSEV